MEIAKMKFKTQDIIMKYLFKNILGKITITQLSKETKLSRVGVWKTIKKMQSEKLINLSKVGSGKTSTYIISLNWDNILIEKKLSLSLTEDALKNERWLNNFAELKDKVEFLILYGSILHSPKEANDIDIMGVISDKKEFVNAEKIILKTQKTQLKKIHSLFFTKQELEEEINKSNKAFIDAIKKGIILFGQDKFIKFIKDIGTR